ncbi:MAG: SLC13 family permease [Ruminococcus sp.]
MNKILTTARDFFRTQTVLCVSFAAAVISMFIVPPDAEYAGYIDYNVIMLLFCLMGVVAGFRSAGIFEKMTGKMLSLAKSKRSLTFILMNICFFTSMLVTNDVALITFVPLALILFKGDKKNCILTVIIQTAAANLGSSVRPVGNPQNIFLYTQYDLSIGFFMRMLLPVGIISYVLLAAACLMIENGRVNMNKAVERSLQYRKLIILSALFMICLLTVLRLIPHYICLVIVCIGLLIEPRLFAKIDYALLFTFACFFVFVGNMGRIEAVRELLSGIMAGRELLVSALVSQVISNVPGAVMLSAFTDNAGELLRGVNIGGLGTPVASLASLISYQLYAKSEGAQKGRYMGMFLVINVMLLAVLLVLGMFVL